jgi:hypothetical protein
MRCNLLHAARSRTQQPSCMSRGRCSPCFFNCRILIFSTSCSSTDTTTAASRASRNLQVRRKLSPGVENLSEHDDEVGANGESLATTYMISSAGTLKSVMLQHLQVLQVAQQCRLER